ncbi:MAG: hypothetical protein ACOYO1_10415 [Bacteroidales bacterium]
MKKNNSMLIGFISLAVIFTYFVYLRIMNPVNFYEEVKRREAIIIDKLRDIRTMEIAYKSVFGKYTGSFDTLADFIQNGKINKIKRTANFPDSLTEEEALKLKLINHDTVSVNAYNELFADKKEVNLTTLKYIPNTLREFKIQANIISKNAIQFSVFEVTADYNFYLENMDMYQVNSLINKAKNLNRFPGLKLGSLEESSTNGNWE